MFGKEEINEKLLRTREKQEQHENRQFRRQKQKENRVKKNKKQVILF